VDTCAVALFSKDASCSEFCLYVPLFYSLVLCAAATTQHVAVALVCCRHMILFSGGAGCAAGAPTSAVSTSGPGSVASPSSIAR